MYWIIKNEFILAILAAVIVGGYRRAAPHNNQSIVTTQSGWIVHWVSASAQTSPNANSNQSVYANSNSINQSMQNQSMQQQMQNQSINAINHKCKQMFNQSINTATFKFMKWMKLQNIGCTPPFVLGCAENATCTCHKRPWITSVCGTATATKGVPSTVVTAAVPQLKWPPLTRTAAK